MKYVKTATLRNNLKSALEALEKGVDYLIITKSGKPVSALVNLDYFEDLLAMSGKEYAESIREARAQYKSGETVGHEELFGEL